LTIERGAPTGKMPFKSDRVDVTLAGILQIPPFEAYEFNI
jgi:hypothetical protein